MRCAHACVAHMHACMYSLSLLPFFSHAHTHTGTRQVVPSLSTGYKALLLNWGWTRDRWSRGAPGCTHARAQAISQLSLARACTLSAISQPAASAASLTASLCVHQLSLRSSHYFKSSNCVMLRSNRSLLSLRCSLQPMQWRRQQSKPTRSRCQVAAAACTSQLLMR